MPRQYRTRKDKQVFPVGVATPRELSTKYEDVPATYYETSHPHRDPLEAWNELMRSAEEELNTSRHAEVGQIEAYDDTPDGSGSVDLGNQDSYPERIGANVDLPDSKGRWYNLSGALHRNRVGGWVGGAELEALDEQ